MLIVKKPARMTQIIRKLGSRSVGFVPTMGALHEGHLTLVRRARRENDIVVVSIFVNPKQFGAGEDYGKYPRPRKDDIGLCRRENVDFVFVPEAKEMYPPGYATRVEVTGLSERLCGKFRKGHFSAVATVVLKLFNIVSCDRAYFGRKDAQQAVIIGRMARDINLPVKIVVVPIVREKDGLAMSSRNAYLSESDRKKAPVLYRALKRGREAIVKERRTDSAKVISLMKETVDSVQGVKLDYLELAEPHSLQPSKKTSKEFLIAVAARIGGTRLIDNVFVRKKR